MQSVSLTLKQVVIHITTAFKRIRVIMYEISTAERRCKSRHLLSCLDLVQGEYLSRRISTSEGSEGNFKYKCQNVQIHNEITP